MVLLDFFFKVKKMNVESLDVVDIYVRVITAESLGLNYFPDLMIFHPTLRKIGVI